MPGNRVSRGPGVAGSGERLCLWGPKRLSWGPGVAGGGDNNIAGGPGVAGDGDNNISWGPGVAGGGDNNISWGPTPGVAGGGDNNIEVPGRDSREARYWPRGPGVVAGTKKIAGGAALPGSKKLAPCPGSQGEYVSELLGNRGSILCETREQKGRLRPSLLCTRKFG